MINPNRSSLWIQLGTILVITVLAGVIFAPIAQAAPPAQDPRPPVDRGGGGESNLEESSKDSNGGEPTKLVCATVSGEVLNWGYRPEPGILTKLQSGSWEVSEISTNDGLYNFSGLGVGIAKLNVSLAPDMPLQPLTSDAVVYLNCDYPIVANLAIYSGPTIELPVTLQMAASNQVVTAGSRTDITLRIDNGLPNDISNVVVTNLIPEGLIAVEIPSSQNGVEENSQIIDAGDDGQVVVTHLDKVVAGETVKIIVAVTAVEDTLVTKVTNTATLFYRESAATQASLDLSVVGSGGLVIPAAAAQPEAASSAAGEEVVSEAVAPADPPTEADVKPVVQADDASDTGEVQPSTTTSTESTAIEDETATVSGAEEADPSTEFEPPDDLLPTTGDDVAGRGFINTPAQTGRGTGSDFMLFIGLGLLLVLGILAYGLRAVQQQRAI